jgi:mRNA-degrading endonuclease RelE of RelBE toxin-antitoxin system
MYRVLMSKRVAKQMERMPERIRKRLTALIEELQVDGPIRPAWPNYGKLGTNLYHCHLSYDWVACWYFEKGTVEIEVYYAGSRENAPY